MKRQSKSLLLAMLVAILAGCSSSAPTELSVMTFNIRLDTASDSLNSWQYRKDNVGQMIRYYHPDVLGMQEVLKNQLGDLKAALPGYTAVGVGRDDGKEKGEFSPVFFKTDRFYLLKEGTYGLSESPAQIGMLGWDAACPRIVTWVMLKDKKTGRKFCFFNTHFDHQGEIARRESARLLMEKMRDLDEGYPSIVTGDFNGTPDSEPIRIITAEEGVHDTRTSAIVKYGPDWTFHDFGRVEVKERELIDYIFVKGQIKVHNYRAIDDLTENGFLSDHNPVISELAIY